ncbi:hypothetical protein D1BOALGB6SA_10309 [Olavius sp. associated proteobacterium Delta 1]|nr:hypothetical protein D1BOALGB6SA_10309 [Olavius sp. associated proteobacterium Delta 1]
MYQVEVKRYLIEHRFHPSDGWSVTVDLDAMEMGKGGQNPPEKREIALHHRNWMEEAGVTIGPHPEYGRVDIVAEHTEHGTFLIEAEGDTSKQKEQSMYSALGQSIIMMKNQYKGFTYGLAFPDDDTWIIQANKIPNHVCSLLNLRLYLVSQHRVKDLREKL